MTAYKSPAEKPDAIVLDFFAGSGTTLNAVALMNDLDGGVTAVHPGDQARSRGEEAARTLSGDGNYLPGTPSMSHGICRRGDRSRGTRRRLTGAGETRSTCP